MPPRSVRPSIQTSKFFIWNDPFRPTHELVFALSGQTKRPRRCANIPGPGRDPLEVTTMQAYATPATGRSAHLKLVDNHGAPDHANVLDLVLDELATRVADQIAARLNSEETDSADPWLDSRSAADYLGVSRSTVRRLAAEGSLNTQQAGANCKLYFRRSELDRWRRYGSVPTPGTRTAA
jgi:excisionase family DNA binding protein